MIAVVPGGASRPALAEGDAPIVQVETVYPGVSAEIMSSVVTPPLEHRFVQIPGLREIATTTSPGRSVTTLTFGPDRTTDAVERLVQTAIDTTETHLPGLPGPVSAKLKPRPGPEASPGGTATAPR